MNDTDEKVKVILNEKETLRQEQCDVQRLMHRTILAFLLAFVGIVGTYFSQNLVPESHKPKLFLSLSQVEALLFLLFCTLLSMANVRGAYIAALERKLNELSGQRLNIWESEICPKYVFGLTSPCFISCVFQGIGYLIVFAILIYLSYDLTNHILWGMVLATEVLVILGLYIWCLAKRREVEAFAKRKLENEKEDSK